MYRCLVCGHEGGAQASFRESGIVFLCMQKDCPGTCIDVDAIGVLTDGLPSGAARPPHNPFAQQLGPEAERRSAPKPAELAVASSEPPNVLRLARERRKWLVAEVRKLRTLEAELAQIDRLLAAAKGQPKPTMVVALKGSKAS